MVDDLMKHDSIQHTLVLKATVAGLKHSYPC